ncbi:hypothetical protein AAG906_040672 [Vitis piasezkii]
MTWRGHPGSGWVSREDVAETSGVTTRVKTNPLAEAVHVVRGRFGNPENEGSRQSEINGTYQKKIAASVEFPGGVCPI